MTPAEFKSRRQAAGLTQVALAGHLGLPVQANRRAPISRSVQDYESGRRPIPGPVAQLMRQLKPQKKKTG